MVSVADQIAQLRAQLDVLARIPTQEDFDEGARLHREKNAPWVNGMYSHLKFPAYVHQSYPRSMYHPQYGPALKQLRTAEAMLVSGTDRSRDLAIQEAQRELDRYVVVVQNEADERIRQGQGWCEGPIEAEQRRLADEQEIAVQAGHLNYEDRNLTGAALAERELADELSEGHLVDVTGTLKAKRGRPRTVSA